MYKIYTNKLGMPLRYVNKILLIMRLTTIILIASLMQVSAAGYAQRITLNERKAPLEKLLKAIRVQSGYDVIMDRKVMDKTKTINISIYRATIEETMDRVLDGLNLSYTIDGKIIVISPVKPSFIDNLTAIFTNITVRGQVRDENGNPLAGAYLRTEANTVSVLTGKDGKFYFSSLPENASLIVSYVGYRTDTVPLKGRSSLTIVLRPQVNEIQEVAIVSTGYQQLDKERATGSFGIVTAKDIAKYPVVSVLERLQGLVPGVNISTKTVAGKSRNGTINIRGISTMVNSYTQVSTDPLLIIDGFPSQMSITNGAFDFINPDDIEQVTFLKDAAAASIWGIQAANGVIVITTKKGRRNSRPSINFSTTFGTSKKPGTAYGTIMSMPDYIDLEKDLIAKGRITSDPTLTTTGFLPENNSQAQAIIFAAKRGAITESQMNEQLTALGKLDNRDQISEYLLQPPATRQYNLSISGGGASSSYFMSGYMYDEDRVYRSNANKGYSFNIGTTSSLLKDHITVSTSLTYGNTRDKINGAAIRAMGVTTLGLRPYDMLTNPDGSTKYYDQLVVPGIARSLESKGYLPFSYSPIDELNYSNTLTNGNNIALNVDVNGKITPWLSATVAGNLGRTFGETETYWEPESYEARMLVNKGTSLSSTGARVYGVPVGGKLDLSNTLGRSYNLRGQLNVNKNWQDKHELNIVLGNEIRETFNKSSGEIRYGYDKSINSYRIVNPTVTYKDIFGNTQTIGATSRAVVEKTTRALSYYLNSAYTYNGKYTISGSARFDDYNLLGVERRKRAIPLWYAGGKWNIKKEEILTNVSWLNQLSARFTYGLSGNAPQGYAPVTVINLLGNEYYSGLPYGVIATPARENLAWEKTRMTNYGLDFSLFGNRVYGSVEYYKKRTTDIFFNLPINATYGFNNTIFNTATLDGKGVDIGLSGVPVSSGYLKWITTMNVSYNTNIVKDDRFKTQIGSLGGNFPYDGYPSDYLFSYKWAGLDSKGESLIRDPKNPDKVYTTQEYPFYDIREYSGRTTSPWFGSFNNSIQYKNFDLNFQFQYALGGVFRKSSIYTFNSYVSRGGDLAQRWRKPGDEAFTNVPGIETGTNTNYFASMERYRESDYLIRSRSNVKLQQVMLSYSLPQQMLAKYGVKGLTFSAVCRNLGLIWTANKEGIDPDYVYTYDNNYQLAPVASYSLRVGLNL